jgi:hypothetical protein
VAELLAGEAEGSVRPAGKGKELNPGTKPRGTEGAQADEGKQRAHVDEVDDDEHEPELSVDRAPLRKPEAGEDEADADELKDDAGEREADEVVTFKELAEHAGITPGQLYNVKVGLGRGKSATLGELKDAYKGAGELQLERDTWDEEREAAHSELLEAQRQIVETLSVMPANAVPPGLRARLDQQQHQHLEKERALLYNALPEWRNEKTRSAEKDTIYALAKRYGVSKAETQNITDHRFVRMLRDYAVLKAAADSARRKRIEAAQAGREQSGGRTLGKTHSQPPGGANGAKPVTRAQRISAVSRLLGG